MKRCEFIIQGDNEIIQCNRGKQMRYGGYCNKHKRKYLIDENNLIIMERFTGSIKDYLIKDLIYYYNQKINDTKGKKYKKQFYFDKVSEFINNLKRHKDNKCIIMDQRMYRNKIKNKYSRYSNTEDFYTFDSLSEIDNKYFYSYKDLNNFHWAFDIRSLIKIIYMNNKNPYTIEDIPENIVIDVKNKIRLLKNKKDYKDIEELMLKDRKESLKQCAVDLFSDIEFNGYSCQINWFYELSGRRLKELYKQLEDIWNYRAQLTNVSKINMCPPDGNMFSTPVNEVYSYNCKEDLQEVILHNISKFKNAISSSDKRLGYMYFIIGLSTVSQDCYLTHPWVSYI